MTTSGFVARGEAFPVYTPKMAIMISQAELDAARAETVAAKKRVSEMSEMLNKAQEAARVQVENERDACERAVQFLLDVAEGTEEGSEKGSDDAIGALKQAVLTLKSRKDSGVRAIQKMAHGSMIGEYIQAHINQALEREKAKWAAVDAAWRGFWTRGGSSSNELRDRGCGASAWLLEQLLAAFKVIDGG